MKVEINVRAYPGDEVWLALEGGPYKATVISVETHINHFQGGRGGGSTLYFVKLEDGREHHVYNVAISYTKEEAQQRLDRYKGLVPYSKEFLKELSAERGANPDVEFIDQEQDESGL